MEHAGTSWWTNKHATQGCAFSQWSAICLPRNSRSPPVLEQLNLPICHHQTGATLKLQRSSFNLPNISGQTAAQMPCASTGAVAGPISKSTATYPFRQHLAVCTSVTDPNFQETTIPLWLKNISITKWLWGFNFKHTFFHNFGHLIWALRGFLRRHCFWWLRPLLQRRRCGRDQCCRRRHRWRWRWKHFLQGSQAWWMWWSRNLLEDMDRHGTVTQKTNIKLTFFTTKAHQKWIKMIKHETTSVIAAIHGRNGRIRRQRRQRRRCRNQGRGAAGAAQAVLEAAQQSSTQILQLWRNLQEMLRFLEGLMPIQRLKIRMCFFFRCPARSTKWNHFAHHFATDVSKLGSKMWLPRWDREAAPLGLSPHKKGRGWSASLGHLDTNLWVSGEISDLLLNFQHLSSMSWWNMVDVLTSTICWKTWYPKSVFSSISWGAIWKHLHHDWFGLCNWSENAMGSNNFTIKPKAHGVHWKHLCTPPQELSWCITI